MTHEEKQRILKDALDRAYLALEAHEDPASESFMQLLRSINELEFSLGARIGDPDCGDFPNLEDPEPEKKPTFTMEPNSTGDEQPASDEPVGAGVSDDVPTEPEPEKPETPTYKMEEVRGALAAARRKGVNVSKLIQSFGVSNFAEIDNAKYPEIMQKLAEEGAV